MTLCDFCNNIIKKYRVIFDDDKAKSFEAIVHTDRDKKKFSNRMIPERPHR